MNKLNVKLIQKYIVKNMSNMSVNANNFHFLPDIS